MIELAGAAVALLIPYLKKAGESLAEGSGAAGMAGLGSLFALVKRKLGGSPDAEKALDDLAESPDDAGRQTELENVLARTAADDTDFADALRRSVQELGGDTRIRELVKVTGGNVGKITIFQGATTVQGDMNF